MRDLLLSKQNSLNGSPTSKGIKDSIAVTIDNQKENNDLDMTMHQSSIPLMGSIDSAQNDFEDLMDDDVFKVPQVEDHINELMKNKCGNEEILDQLNKKQ